MPNHPIARSPEKLHTWLAERVASYVQRDPQEIKPDVPLAEYGLSSVYALSLSGEIEDFLGISLDPTVVWDYPTIEKLAAVLLAELATA